MVAKTNAKTLQEKFGFVDNDLTTPDHDMLMIWLDSEAEQIANDIFAHELQPNIEELQTQAARYVSQQRAQKLMVQDCEYSGLGNLPEFSADIVVKNRIWEYPINTNSNYIVGFVDFFVEVEANQLSWDVTDSRYKSNAMPHWVISRKSSSLFFEVKTVIRSVGEVIRQVQMYKQYWDRYRIASNRFYIVSPDDRFADVFRSQDIGFIAAPKF